MGSSVVDVGPRLAVILVVPTALVAAAGRFCGPGQDRPVVAAARATAALAAVSAVLLAARDALLSSSPR